MLIVSYKCILPGNVVVKHHTQRSLYDRGGLTKGAGCGTLYGKTSHVH